MLYNFLYPLAGDVKIFNLFKYLTFRTGGAVVTALILTLFIGPKIIAWLRKKQKEGQPIRLDGPESHLQTKKGTPTMGGLMMLISIAVSTLLWADATNQYVWAVAFVTLSYGVIGLLDDYIKVTKKTSNAMSAKTKLLLQFAVAGIAVWWITSVTSPDVAYKVAIPFTKNIVINLGQTAYIIFAMFVIVGASNAVNLTDGLDGLATGSMLVATAVFMLISYIVGNAVFTNYLQVSYVPGVGELAVFCGAIIGAALGFLWFNAPPASVFMGDTGSLALGGAIGAVSVAAKHEIVLAIVGGLFVIEACSVMIQVGVYKMTKKRVFKMAPIHHHFEKNGWAETKVVVRFWIVSIILAIVGLATLKLR